MSQGAFPALNVKVPIAQPQSTSPLDTLQQYGNLTNLLIQNQQNQQVLQARQAIGQAYRNSIDPQTGQLNTTQLLANVARDPRAAYLAGDVASAAQARQAQQLQIQGQQLDQAMKRNNYAATELGALVPLGGGITRNDVYSRLGDAVNNGIMTPQQASQFAMTMPQTDGPQLAQWVKQQYGTVLANQQYLQGQIQTINSGGQTNLVQTSPLTGQASQIGAIGNTLSPGEATAPTQIGTTPGGQPIMGTRAQFVGATQPAGPFGDGRYPGSAPAGGGPQPGGGVAMGLPAGQQQAMEEQGQFSAKQYNEIAQNAANVPANKALLQNMAGDLTRFTSGPGNVEWRTAVASLNRAFGTNFDAEGVASAENFAKLGNQIAIAQAGQMGAGTNEKLEASMQANPNPHLSVPGNQQIIHVLLGNQDAVGAWNQAAQAYQAEHGPTSYQQFVADTSKWFEPRAFQMLQMTPEEQAATWNSMTKADQAQFKADVEKMDAAGMFSGMAQPQAATPAAAPQVPTAP